MANFSPSLDCGGMERRERYVGQNVHDPDDDTEHSNLSRSRPESELLRPFDASAMRCFPVSSRENNVQSDDAECCMLVALESSPQRGGKWGIGLEAPKAERILPMLRRFPVLSPPLDDQIKHRDKK